MTWPGHESFAAKIVRIFVPVPASQRVKRLFDNKRRGHLTRISELLMLWKHCLQSVALEVRSFAKRIRHMQEKLVGICVYK